MEKRFVKNRDEVYWVEPDENMKPGIRRHTVENGYYLASYQLSGRDMHIVSLGSVTSCVVRHLEDNEIFVSIEDAQKRADELNEIRSK